MKEFAGKVAVITGGASGIGLAMAERFIKEGMKIVLADIDPKLESVAQRLRDGGAQVLAVKTDVSDAAQVDALAARTVAEFGTAHIVCNNAGTGGPAAFEDLSLDDWKFQLGVNLWGPINGIRAFLPILRKQDEGHIVNTASMASFVHGPFIAPYNTAKAAVAALTETLYHELACEGSNVHISVVCPGSVVTNLNEEPNVPEARKLQKRRGSPAIEKMRADLRESFKDALTPQTVADMVIDAIRNERLHVITHPQFIPMMKQRFDSIIAGANQMAVDLKDVIDANKTA